MPLEDRIALALAGVCFIALSAAGFALGGSPGWLPGLAGGLGCLFWFAAFDSGDSQ